MRQDRRVRSFIIHIALVATLVPAVPVYADGEKDIELRVGAALGGAPFLRESFGGLVRETTADWSGIVYGRLSLPKISPRSLELFTVVGKGYGFAIRNDDFRYGRLRLHLFDLGLFWNVHKPVTAARVPRKLDLNFGLGMEWEFTRRVSLTFDWRTFMPLNVFSVLTKNGDYSRLIGEEVVKGGQAWLGVSYSF